MKTQKQRINAARQKIQKFSENIDALAGKMQDICDEFDDEELCEHITAVTDILNDLVVGNGEFSFPAIDEYMQDYAEASADLDDDED